MGWSKARKKWMEAPRNMHMTLQGKAVHLLSQSLGKGTDESFEKFWTLVLEKLGAKIVTGRFLYNSIHFWFKSCFIRLKLRVYGYYCNVPATA